MPAHHSLDKPNPRSITGIGNIPNRPMNRPTRSDPGPTFTTRSTITYLP